MSETEAATAKPRRGRGLLASRRARFGIMGVMAVVIFIAVSSWLYARYSHVYVQDSRLSATMVTISSRVPGWVTTFPVGEGQQVEEDALLIDIDSRDARLQLAELDARLQSLAAEQASLRAQRELVDRRTASSFDMFQSRLAEARARYESAKSDFEQARNDFDRSEKLLAEKVISRQRWENDRNRRRKADQEFQRAKANVDTAAAALEEARAERLELEVIEQRLMMMAAEKTRVEAQRDRQSLDVADRAIRSPLPGVVDETFIDVGEYVRPGQRLLMIHDPRRVWVIANIKETEIRHVKVGAHVDVTVDAYPGEKFDGKVTRIGNAATSQFALLPNPNPSGNFTKITQRIEVRVDVEQRDNMLKPGMMVELAIDIPGR